MKDDSRHVPLVVRTRRVCVESDSSYQVSIPSDVKDTSCASWTEVSALSHRGGGSAHRNKVNRETQVGELLPGSL